MKPFDIFLEFFEDPATLCASKTGPVKLEYPMHYHPAMELLYCEDGSLTIFLDKAAHTMKKGSFAIIFPLAVHSFSCPEACSCTFLHIPESVFLQIENMFSLSSQHTGYIFDSFEHTDLLENIYHYARQDDQKIASYYAMILLTLSLRQIQDMAPRITAAERNSYPLLREVLSYIQDHYKEAITLDVLCEEFNVGKSTMSRLINTDLQSSLPELINKYRMLEAGHLLLHSQQNINQIADTLGYASACSFTRNFRKHFGVSPREYRKKPT